MPAHRTLGLSRSRSILSSLQQTFPTGAGGLQLPPHRTLVQALTLEAVHFGHSTLPGSSKAEPLSSSKDRMKMCGFHGAARSLSLQLETTRLALALHQDCVCSS